MDDKYPDERKSVNQAYVELWGSMQGALHPYVKALMPLVGRSLVDEEFRKWLLEDSDAVFREEKISFLEGVKIKVIEDSQDMRHLVLPP